MTKGLIHLCLIGGMRLGRLKRKREIAHGYYVQGDLLERKWVSCDSDFGGEAIFQIVVPSNFYDVVLQMAHSSCGHLGVRKTYDCVLWYFFWPWLKCDIAKYSCQLIGKPSQVVEPALHCPILVIGQPSEHLTIVG